MKFDVDVKKIIDRALSGGGQFCDIFVEKKVTSSITCEENKIQNAIVGSDSGVGLRLIKNNRSICAFANSFEEKDIVELADKIALAGDGDRDIDCSTILREKTFNSKNYFKDTDTKLKWVKQGNDIIRSHGDSIVQVKVAYHDVTREVLVANSEGLCVTDKTLSSYYVAQTVARKGDVIQTGYEVAGGNGEFDISVGDRWMDVCNTSVGRALRMLDAEQISGGKMPVVLSSKAGGTMVHEAIGHGLEADLAGEGLSVYADRVGKLVASPLITIVDDATIPGKRGTFNFDDDGIEAQRTVLVENGVLKTYMYDRLSAMKKGVASTGNGRRESFRFRPIVRMTNTVILPGESDPEEITRSVKNGLYVVSMGGGQVNTVNGDFVFEVVEGYKIENGEVTTPVRGATLSANGPVALNNIDCVGSDLGYGVGVCGKDGQGVGVSDAQPTLLLKEITVGGTA